MGMHRREFVALLAASAAGLAAAPLAKAAAPEAEAKPAPAAPKKPGYKPERFTLDYAKLTAYQGAPSRKRIEEQYLKNIKRAEWRKFIADFYAMKEPQSQYKLPRLANWSFESAPGSGAHHTHIGGLAQHTLQNLDYARAWVASYAAAGVTLDTDILFGSILLHDYMKRFIYAFDQDGKFSKSEDKFIAKNEDHHSWVLRELTARKCPLDLLLGTAAMHGIDDVSLAEGVKGVAIVDHYLKIGDTGATYTPDNIRPEHVVAFLADSDWHWSGMAQARTAKVAALLAPEYGVSPDAMKLYLGSRFTFVSIGHVVDTKSAESAARQFKSYILKA